MESSPKSALFGSWIRDPFIWILSAFIVGSFFVFHDSQWDIWAAKLFFHPENRNPWFEEDFQPWIFFYHAAPWLTGVLLGSAFIGLWRSRKKKDGVFLQKSSILIFLLIALGPGLVINSILKPYWGRPRPREVRELGGHHVYQPFYQLNFASGGKSFPCGHCSVGFSYGAGYFIFRRRRPWLARGFLIFSLLFGFLMGIGRIAAGGHFLSDVIWAGIIVYSVAYGLSRYLFPNETSASQREGEASPYAISRILQLWLGSLGELWKRWIRRNPVLEKMSYILLGGGVLAALLLATPYQSKIETHRNLEMKNSILIRHASIEIVDSMSPELILSGSARGFGFPGSKAFIECRTEGLELECQFGKTGVFSDFESVLTLAFPFSRCEDMSLDISETAILNFSELPECIQNSLLSRQKPLQIQNKE